MTQKELVDMVISERINWILTKKKTAVRSAKESELFEKHERLLKELDQEKRLKIEEYLDEMVELDAEMTEALYLGGVRDGLCLMMRILKMVKN